MVLQVAHSYISTMMPHYSNATYVGRNGCVKHMANNVKSRIARPRNHSAI